MRACMVKFPHEDQVGCYRSYALKCRGCYDHGDRQPAAAYNFKSGLKAQAGFLT